MSEKTETHKEMVEKLSDLNAVTFGGRGYGDPTYNTSMRVRPTDPEYRARSPSSLPILIIACSMPR